jgi:hypothetical protein
MTSAEEEEYLNNLKKQEAILQRKLNPIGMIPVLLPGEKNPRVITDYGDDIQEDYERLEDLQDAQFSHAGGWKLGKDGLLHLDVILPGEHMGNAFQAHMAEHKKRPDHRMNGAMFQFTPDPLGGGSSSAYIPSITQGYSVQNGPFRMNALTSENGTTSYVYGGRAANQLFHNSADLYATKVAFGCPLVVHEETGEPPATKRIKLQKTMDHIRSFKGQFNPMSYNQGDVAANPSFIYLNKPSGPMSGIDAAKLLTNQIPNLSPVQAKSIVDGMQTQFMQRFSGALPSNATYQAYDSNVYHPMMAYVSPAGRFEHANETNAKYALTDKTALHFGSGIALQYGVPGHATSHVFSNVFTPIVPAGSPQAANLPVLNSSWYPHAEEAETYVIQPTHQPNVPPQHLFSMPIGNNGLGFLSSPRY